MHATAVQGAPPAPPAPWLPPSRTPENRVIVVVIAVITLASFASLAVLSLNPGIGASGFVFFPVCGLIVVLVLLAIAGAMGAFRRAPLPPPPPIQQPMVPAGRLPPIAINCPNCGAPPGAVDRFGMATCTHCGARFIVR